MDPVTCPACGYSKSPPGGRFCANCGEALPAQPGEMVVIDSKVNVDNMQGGKVSGVNIGKIVGTVIFGSDDEVRARDRRNQRVLLQKVTDFWVDGVLQASLGDIPALDLTVRMEPDAVRRPLEELAETPAKEVLPDASIDGAFEALDEAVLLLDGAGSGKTTTLLQLAQAAVRRAAQDPEQPVPVVLNLAPWVQVRQPIAEWIANELTLRYQIPGDTGTRWLREGRLALLLDGLDEVGEENIAECIGALNAFRREHGLLAMCVCTRKAAYIGAGERLNLGGALELLPLNGEQVQTYLQSAGERGQTLERLLGEDDALVEMTSSPLMLNVMTQAFEGMTPADLDDEALDTPQERRVFLLERYIERIFTRKKSFQTKQFSKGRVLSWLGELAGGMQREHQAIFLIEQLQPSWFDGGGMRWAYWLLSRGIVGLLIGLLLAGTAEVAGTLAGRAFYLACSVLAGLLIGGVTGTIDELRRRQQGWSEALLLPGVLWTPICALIAGLAFLAGFGGLLGLGGDAWRLAAGLAVVYAILYGMSGLRPAEADVRPVESLSWSLREALEGVIPGLALMAATLGVIWAIFSGSNPTNVWLQFGLVYGALGFLAMILVYGLRGAAIQLRSYPNQGAWLSWRNALRAGGLLGLVAGLGYGIFYGFGAGFVLGLRVGVIAGLYYGAYDGIKAACMRALLGFLKQLPWRLVRFLDYAASLGLLQKVGGGYRFPSRLVQEYLAGGRER